MADASSKLYVIHIAAFTLNNSILVRPSDGTVQGMEGAMKMFLPMILMLGACNQEEFECCQNGVIENCTCGNKELCMRESFNDHGDGTCSTGPMVETAEPGDTAP